MPRPKPRDVENQKLQSERQRLLATNDNRVDTAPPDELVSSEDETSSWSFIVKYLLAVMVLSSFLLGALGWSAEAESGSPHKHHNIGADIIQIKHLDPRHVPELHTPKGTRGKRLVIVGDVHGCSLELTHLLKKVDFDTRHDHLILTGDMVDKGPDSHGVLAMASKLGASCIRGNHEDNLLKSHYEPLEYPASQKIQALQEALVEADYEFLLACPLILSLGDIPSLRTKQAVVVHAGLVPHVNLEEQPPWDVMHMRTMSKNFVPSEERDGGEPWWRVWHVEQKKLPKRERTTVIYGHDSRQGLVEKKYSFGLDTACSKGGRLTALVLGSGEDEREIVSVKCADYSV